MRRLIDSLASMKLTVVLLCLLSVLVVWGTLYQTEHGLYEAQQRFYQSYGFMIMGVIPFPGTQLVLAVLFVNLLCAMFVSLRYQWGKAGSLLTHAGLLVFLAGGFVVGSYTRESNLTLEEGEGSNVSVAYHDWEVAAWEHMDAEPAGDPPHLRRRVSAVGSDAFAAGDIVRLEGRGLLLEVETYFRNAGPRTDRADVGETAPLNSGGVRALAERPAEKEPSANLPGGIFRLKTPEGEVQRVLLSGFDRVPTRVEAGGRSYDIALRRRRTPLPFTVVLNDFQREMHPNSNMARSYASEVTVLAGETSRRVRIAMNQPLRYRGFTLFQSSYRELGDGREFSTFAVVSNRGRYLPYVGSFIVFAGLMAHFLIVIYDKREKTS